MSFLKKMLSSVGIGAATVDTEIDHVEAIPGEAITGTIYIKGGHSTQKINKIDLELFCNYFVEVTHTDDNDEPYTEVVERQHRLASYHLEDSFEIHEDEEKELSFSIPLPENAPISISKTICWLETNLDIPIALDPTDRDTIEVIPNTLQQGLLEAMNTLGFQLNEAECEGSDKRQFGDLPFVQEFEFKPISGEFIGRVKEVELVMKPEADRLVLYMEIDRKARGLQGFFAEALDMDETNLKLIIEEDHCEQLPDLIANVIQQHC
ncbi:sporulation protein [Algicola sagamiensis]|uniref:sporulation protein n=1 Tax=Algicola sagamiensis TaxID=163869 RepID=UPI00037D52B4|nr:sporulation protein [Algicola sagamiensis]